MQDSRQCAAMGKQRQHVVSEATEVFLVEHIQKAQVQVLASSQVHVRYLSFGRAFGRGERDRELLLPELKPEDEELGLPPRLLRANSINSPCTTSQVSNSTFSCPEPQQAKTW
jgi:hypothetical protein